MLARYISRKAAHIQDSMQAGRFAVECARFWSAAFANQYRWCSAAWFERTSAPAMVKSIYAFKIDRLNIAEDY